MTAARPFEPDGDNCSVNGRRPRPGEELWEGLDWSWAVWRGKSSLMVALVGAEDAPADWHWEVPHRDPYHYGHSHRVREVRRRRRPFFAGRTPPLMPTVEPTR